jgi:hypothetical protein
MADPISYISSEEVPSPLANALTREIKQVTPSNYTPESNSGPVLTTFGTLQSEPAVSDHLEEAVANNLFALVIPPVDDNGKPTSVSTIGDAELTIRHSKTERIHIGQRIFSDTPEKELNVSTVGYFDSYSGLRLGRDQNDEPVLIELRETSTTGGVLFTTVVLNELAISCNEQHRRDLIAALIAYLDDVIEDTKQIERTESIDEPSTEESETARSVPSEQYDAGLLTLYYYVHSDKTVELTSGLPETVLPAGLSAEFTDEEWDQFIEVAESDGLISDSGLQAEAVSAAVDDRNLRSFARRLEI